MTLEFWPNSLLTRSVRKAKYYKPKAVYISFGAQFGKCYVCGKTASTYDHIVPQSIVKLRLLLNVSEGPNVVAPFDNRQRCCATCNGAQAPMQSAILILLQGRCVNKKEEQSLSSLIIRFYKSPLGQKIVEAKNKLAARQKKRDWLVARKIVPS